MNIGNIESGNIVIKVIASNRTSMTLPTNKKFQGKVIHPRHDSFGTIGEHGLAMIIKISEGDSTHLILFDTTLMNEKEISEQMVPGGFLLRNGDNSYNRDALKSYTVGSVDALKIARKNGLEAIVNTAILGAYVRLTEIVSLDMLLKVIRDTVPGAIDQNVAAAQEAYEKLSLHQKV